MQTIKGLIALLLAAVAVFVVVARNDIKSQDKYAAKVLHKATAVNADKNAVNEAGRKTSRM